MDRSSRDDAVKNKLSKINPTEQQLRSALDTLIINKEIEVLLEGSMKNVVKAHDCRVELMALYRAKALTVKRGTFDEEP